MDTIVKKMISVAEDVSRGMFIKRKGIMQPIRACVWEAEGPDTVNEFEAYMHILEHISDETHRFREGDPDKLLKQFKMSSEIVGYFTACMNDTEDDINFGIALCRPKDKPTYCAEYGKFLAFDRALKREWCTFFGINSAINDKKFNKYLDSEIYFDEKTGESTLFVYQYLFSVSEQLKYFVNRCERYFKVNCFTENKSK